MGLIPFFIFSAILSGLLILLAAVLFSSAMDRRNLFRKVSIAICLNSDGSDETIEEKGSADLKTSMMIRMVESMESVKSVSDFSYMSPKDARDGMADGTVDAAIYLPKGIYSNINTGVNTPVLIRVSEKNGLLTSGLFTRLVSDGVSLIRTVETAIYSVDRLSETEKLVKPLTDIEDRIFGVYVASGLDRLSVFEASGISVFGDMTMLEFYASSALVLILLIFGISFRVFYGQDERNAAAYLSRAGLGDFALSAARIIAGTIVLSIMAYIVAAALRTGLAAQAAEAPFASAFAKGLPDALRGTASHLHIIILMALSAAAFIHLIYTLAPLRYAGLVYLLTSAALFIMTGGLLPQSWMPGALRALSGASPVTIWQMEASRAIFGLKGAASIAGGVPLPAAALICAAILLAVSFAAKRIILFAKAAAAGA